MNIYDYETSGGKNIIKEYIDELSIDLKSTAYSIREKIHTDGIAAFDGLNTRQLKKKLWEIKFSSNRLMYVIENQNNVYFVHICKKQKGKSELFELKTAIGRVKELEKLLNKNFL